MEYSSYLGHVFAAPELSDEDCIPSYKCDIYSFGIMMYSILIQYIPKNLKEIDLKKFNLYYIHHFLNYILLEQILIQIKDLWHPK